MSELLLILITVLAAGGAIGVYIGWKKHRVYEKLTDVDVHDLRQLRDTGTVATEGEVVDVEEPIDAPFTDRQAAVLAWKVEEWDERGDSAHWREVARGIEARPFTLDDGTAEVEVSIGQWTDTAGKWTQTTGVTASDGVRLDDVLAEFSDFPVAEYVEAGDEIPAHVREFERRIGLHEAEDSITNIVDIGNKHGDRRYHEQVIRPVDDAYVLGQATAAADATHPLSPEDVTVEPAEGSLCVVSDQDEDSIKKEYGGSARTMIAAGVVCIFLAILVAVLFAL